MAVFQSVEIFTDVACNSGTRVQTFPLDALVTAQATFSLTGEEQFVFAVYRDDERASAIVRGLVARVVTDDTSVFDEWRIADLVDGGTGEDAILTVTCNAISVDLTRALYRTFDAVGVPVHDYALADATATDVLDGPVRDALDTAELDWIVTGTVDPTNTFDINGEWETARQIVDKIPDPARVDAEFRLRRNGTTDYQMDILSAVGSSLPTLRVNTGRNLRKLRRQRLFADSATQVVPRGQEDSTERTPAFAFWEITAVSANAYIEVIDPRGGSYPGPARFADQFNSKYAAVLDPTYAEEQIVDTIVQSATTTRLTMASTTGFTVGGYIEFREGTGSTSGRTCMLDHPAAQVLNGGIFTRILELGNLTGAINYAKNAVIEDMTNNQFQTQAAGANTIDSSTASTAVTKNTGNTLFTQRVWAGDILVRASDNATIGTVLTVTDNDNIVLTANAALTLTNEVWAVRKPMPTGWTASATDNGNLPRLNHESLAESISVSGAYRIRGSFSSTNQFNTPVFPVDKDKLWHFWLWFDARVIPAGCTVTFTVRREDTGAQVGDAIAFTDADTGSMNPVVFTAYDVSASTTGVRIRAVVTSGGATLDLWLGPVGCQPSTWTRRDVYAPWIDAICANDLVHAGNDYLEDAIAPAAYDCEIVDREQIDADTYPNDAIGIGQSVIVTDEDLGIEVNQRVYEMTRDYLAHDTQVRFSSPAVTFGQFTEKRRKRFEGFEFDRRVALTVGRKLIRAAAAVSDRSITEVAAGDDTSTAADAIAAMGEALIGFEAS